MCATSSNHINGMFSWDNYLNIVILWIDAEANIEHKKNKGETVLFKSVGGNQEAFHSKQVQILKLMIMTEIHL
jgi:hypothetical protein